MTPGSLHNLFVAAASVAGALIGLLFVAISIGQERLTGEMANQVDRVRARAALVAFLNALVVSLFALMPDSLGETSASVAVIGLVFVLASVLSVRRVGRPEAGGPEAPLPGAARTSGRRERVTGLGFLVLQIAVFVVELVGGIELIVKADNPFWAERIATAVIVCFLIGISRSWELIGGPEIGLSHELRERIRTRDGDSS